MGIRNKNLDEDSSGKASSLLGYRIHLPANDNNWCVATITDPSALANGDYLTIAQGGHPCPGTIAFTILDAASADMVLTVEIIGSWEGSGQAETITFSSIGGGGKVLHTTLGFHTVTSIQVISIAGALSADSITVGHTAAPPDGGTWGIYCPAAILNNLDLFTPYDFQGAGVMAAAATEDATKRLWYPPVASNNLEVGFIPNTAGAWSLT